MNTGAYIDPESFASVVRDQESFTSVVRNLTILLVLSCCPRTTLIHDKRKWSI